mmetsp:Transcript_6167/g.12129  ORF Transcript_6167/g.12129 Transcript_6167/m.12129 type:complete len:276 (+) Transcript_6167:214-1041(+)
MRQDDWELQITIDGSPLEEYEIEGRTVVTAHAGKHFTVKVAYRGDEHDVFLVRVLIDGDETDNWRVLRRTGRSGSFSPMSFKGWVKAEGKDEACSAFVFEAAHVDVKSDDSCSFGVGGTDWSRGVVELQIQKARREIAKFDIPWPRAQFSKNTMPGLSERELVKGGLSSSVGRGETEFSERKSAIMVHAGEATIKRDKNVAVQSYVLYYRDDFFLAVHGHGDFDGAPETEFQKGRGKASVRRIKNLRKKVHHIQQVKAKIEKRNRDGSEILIDLT